MKKEKYSICGMCTVRCPIRAEVEGNGISWLEGNPHLLGGALCARGSAGLALLDDPQRPQQPLIRAGARGEGKWRPATWEEALKLIAEKLEKIRQEHGPEAVVLSSRGGPWQGLYKSFIHAFGSPNYTNHDAVCGRNTHHASLSINGVGRTGFAYDIRNARHLILFGRDMFSSMHLDQGLQTLDMLERGGRLTYVDVRQTMTGVKATRFMQIKPGTDYALALALINGVIKDGYFDQNFISRHVSGFDELCEFIQEYTPDWAARQCQIPAKEIGGLIRDIGEDRPRVIFHPGWNLARYGDSFYASRAMHILNVLMGNIEIEGGLFVPKGAKDFGKKEIRSISIARPDIKRADGIGWKYKHFDQGPGLVHLMYEAIKTGQPYPLKAWIAMRHDLLSGLPDPEAQKQLLNKLDLLVSIDTNYSEFSWFSDVILPESAYLERASFIVQQKGLRPRLARREQIVPPRYDTRANWEIFRDLARCLGMNDFFPFETIEDFWQWQLEPTGYTCDDFNEKGFIELGRKPVYYGPERLEQVFRTPSGKIEIISSKLTEAGLPSLKPFTAPEKPEKGLFRLIYGKTPVHTQGHTTNNPLLSEQMPLNCLWLNQKAAQKMAVAEGDLVEVSSADGSYRATIPAHITPFIHEEAVYTAHGFGKEIPAQKRSLHAGLADQKLMVGSLEKWDRAGGGVNLCEAFVRVKRSIRNNLSKITI